MTTRTANFCDDMIATTGTAIMLVFIIAPILIISAPIALPIMFARKLSRR